MEPVLRVTGKRYETGLNGSPPFDRFEVAPGVFLSLFDDGRVKVRMDPADGCEVKVKQKDATYPGSKMLGRNKLGATNTDDEDIP